MNRKLKYLLMFTTFVIVSGSSDVLFRRTKRTDIDLPTCIDNFDIHKDKIIRTQDSQKMGAKYLNAIDLGSREECLRLCCETDNCDVFVYEDKSSGSCYLFRCGPPEDFKCKFTHHVNYSSAVLAINRHIPDLESQIKLTKHEQDLTKLRNTDVELEPAPHIPLTITPSTTVKPFEIQTEQQKIQDKKCSRYQFECRSTRECIAIYNACDGIPQCADGSDEAAELGCPDSSTSPPPAPLVPRVLASSPTVASANDKNKVATRSQVLSTQNNVYRPPSRPEDLSENQMISASKPDFLRPIPQEQRIPQRPSPYQESLEYNPQMPQLGWNTHHTGQIYPIPPDYQGKSSHIFNHKENGLQVPESEIRYNRFKGAMHYLHRTLGAQNQIVKEGSYVDNGNYPKIPVYYGENYRQPMETPNWVNAHQEDLRYPTRYNQEPSYPINKAVENQEKLYKSQTKSTDWSNDKEVNPEHIQIKMAHELERSKSVNIQEKAEEISKKKLVEKTPEVREDDFPDVVAYKMDGNDGVAQTPGGAVLSLTLGLIITCIMAIMIGCRLRIVKRRIRKGGKGYAHDADYLVNGMYL